MGAKKTTKHSTRRARVVTQETDIPFLGIRDYPSQFDIDENKQCLLKCHKPHKVKKKTKDIQVFLESFDFFKCEYFRVEDYLHKIECSVHPKHLVTTLWCPTIFKKDSPIANTPLCSLPTRLIYELESVRTYLSLNANPEIINQIIDHAIHCAHKLELDFKEILDIYQENHTKHTIRDWLFKFGKECGQLNRRFSPFLDEDARRKRTNLVWAISKAIDDLGLRELAGEEMPDSQNGNTATLAEFLETNCGADKIAIDRAKNNIKQACKDKKITLPKTANQWIRGKTKIYFVSDLIEKWPNYRLEIPILPPLKTKAGQ